MFLWDTFGVDKEIDALFFATHVFPSYSLLPILFSLLHMAPLRSIARCRLHRSLPNPFTQTMQRGYSGLLGADGGIEKGRQSEVNWSFQVSPTPSAPLASLYNSRRKLPFHSRLFTYFPAAGSLFPVSQSPTSKRFSNMPKSNPSSTKSFSTLMSSLPPLLYSITCPTKISLSKATLLSSP